MPGRRWRASPAVTSPLDLLATAGHGVLPYPTSPVRFLCFLVFGFCALSAPGPTAAGAEKRKRGEKETLPKPPPQPVPATLKVLRRGQVEVPLRIYGQQTETVRFLIRTAPETGELSAPQQLGQQSGQVVYAPPADKFEVKQVRFLYAARTAAGVSAPAEVIIDIVDDPAQLITPAEVFFPTLMAGAVGRQEFELVNQGGLVAEGRIAVDKPYTVVEPAEYRLLPGGRRKVAVEFAPQAGGSFRRELRFSSQVDRVVVLQGQANEAVALSATELTLTQTAGDPRRSGQVEVVNHTLEEQRLAIPVPARLEMPGELVVPAEGKAKLVISAKADDPLGLREVLTLAGAGLELHLAVQAPALAPTLKPQEAAVKLPAKASAAGGQVEVTVENLGATAGFWRCEVPPPFTTMPAECRVEPRARQVVLVRWSEAPPGPYRAPVLFTGEQQTLSILVEGTLIAPLMAAAAPVWREAPAVKTAMTATPPPKADKQAAAGLLENLPTSVRRAGPPVRWGEKTSTTATLLWPAAPARGQKLEVQVRQFSLENKQLKVRWEKMPGVVQSTQGEESRAVLQGLKPQEPYFVRVMMSPQAGGAGRAIFQGQVVTLPQAPTGWVLIGLAIAGGGAAVWHRWWKGRRSEAGR